MSEPQINCPKCQGELADIGGVQWCPVCGIQIAPGNKPASVRSKRLFWILLVSPAALALASFVVGQMSFDAGIIVGMVALFIGAIGSIYCGCWLAKAACKTSAARFFAGAFFILAISVVNFFLIFAGCAHNVIPGH